MLRFQRHICLLAALSVFLGPQRSYAELGSDLAAGTRSGCRYLYGKVVSLGGRAQGLRENLRGYTPEDKRLLALQWLHHFRKGSAAPVPAEAGFFRNARRFLGNGAKKLLHLLVPVPLPSWSRTELEELFLKVWLSPRFEPSPEEVALLKKAGAYEAFLGRQKFALANPNGALARDLIGISATVGGAGLLYLNAAMALNQAREMSENTVVLDDFFKQPSEDENGHPVVQLLVETAPFPHAAIRIGYKVYSYGQEYMTSKDIHEYLADLSKLQQEPKPANPTETAPPPPAVLDSPDPQGFTAPNEFASFPLAWNGLKSVLGRALSAAVKSKELRRSVRVTTLKLDPDAVAKLQRALELNTAKKYLNRTMANDCSTMISRALEENHAMNLPAAIDALPSVLSSYLSLRRTLGDPQVGPTQLLLMRPEDSKAFHIARNTYIAMLEGKLALGLLAFNAAERAYIDSRKTEGELQFYTPDIQAKLDESRRNTQEALATTLNELLGGDILATLHQEGNPQARKQKADVAKQLLEQQIEDEIAEANRTLDYPGADFQDVIVATEQLKVLEELRQGWLKKIDKAAASETQKP